MEASFGRIPHPGSLGYQAALDAGFVLSDSGASEAALPYFQRAADVRSTSIALTQLGKCLRDLGRLDQAAVAYRRAVTASGGTGHARVALIALLNEMGAYHEAAPLAEDAFRAEPDNSAVLNVLASALHGLATNSAASEALPADMRANLLARVRDLRAHAQRLSPESPEDRLQRRRDRTFPVHSITPITTPGTTPVEQSRTTLVMREAPEAVQAPPMAHDAVPADDAKPTELPRARGRLRRWLRALLA